MILLDTNVVSALMQSRPEPVIVAWLDGQAPDEIWTTSITIFEVRHGLDRLPPSRRAESLREAFQHLLNDELLDRIAPVDRAAGEAAARLGAERSRRGRPVEIRDTLIGGIAIARKATLATRNLRHFDDCGAPVIDPWAA